jgi:hypothetical protein
VVPRRCAIVPEAPARRDARRPCVRWFAVRLGGRSARCLRRRCSPRGGNSLGP